MKRLSFNFLVGVSYVLVLNEARYAPTGSPLWFGLFAVLVILTEIIISYDKSLER